MIRVDFANTLAFFIFSFVLFLYAVSIYFFYRFMSKRDFFTLDLKKYELRNFEFLRKFYATIKYLLEYLVIYPFFTLFWFLLMSFFLFFLNKNSTLDQIFFITVSLIGGIRISAYFSEELSKDLAKLIPFSMLGIFLVEPSFFDLSLVVARFLDIGSLFSLFFDFIAFSIMLEFGLRTVFSAFNLLRKV